jgi:hypothetical protein
MLASPSIVTLPAKGETLTVSACGQTLTVRRNSCGRDWHCFIVTGGRTRFGNADEIRQDIEYFRQSGALPPRSGNSWA